LLASPNWTFFLKKERLEFTIFSFVVTRAQIGSGTYSNVYKAIEVESGRVVALKKVRVDGVGEAESARFMAREIALLRRLGDHPNVVRLNGLVTSRLNTAPSLYLVFEYMEHDLTGLTACATASGRRLSLPQVRSPSLSPCMEIVI
jgi:cyclin-dependent kinase 12/13